MKSKVKVDCETCGEVTAVATIVVNGFYSTWEEPICKTCLLRSINDNPESLFVADITEEETMDCTSNTPNK